MHNVSFWVQNEKSQQEVDELKNQKDNIIKERPQGTKKHFNIPLKI